MNTINIHPASEIYKSETDLDLLSHITNGVIHDDVIGYIAWTLKTLYVEDRSMWEWQYVQ